MKKKKSSFCAKLGQGIVALGLVIALERGTHMATDGFTLIRIHSDLPFNPHFAPPALSEGQKTELKKLFDQKFHYLACGSQSFVFESEDGQTILKFFKHHRFRTPTLLRSLPLTKGLKQMRTERMAKKAETLHETLASCLFSFEHLKNETGTIYPHLTKSQDLNLQARLIDRLGIEHRVDLDQLEFVIQTKAQSLPEYFLALRNNRDHEKAKEAFDQLLELAEKRCLMGYIDKDPNLIRNFGFIDGKAVEIDIGGFVPFAQPDPRRFYTRDIVKIKNKSLAWFEKNYPEIADYIRSQIDSLTDTP